MKVTEIIFRIPYTLHSDYPIINILETFENKLQILPHYSIILQYIL